MDITLEKAQQDLEIRPNYFTRSMIRVLVETFGSDNVMVVDANYRGEIPINCSAVIINGKTFEDFRDVR